MTDTPGDGAAPMRRIGLGEFQADMDEIRPPAPAPWPPRQPGALRGRIQMAEDFNRLPPDLLTAMEGGER